MGIQLLDASGNPLKIQSRWLRAHQPASGQRRRAWLVQRDDQERHHGGRSRRRRPGPRIPLEAATPTTSLALIRRIKFSAWNLGTGFTAGNFLFDFLVARAFTVQDTGGGAATLTTNNAKLRTSFATTQAAIQASTTATLSAGTRTLDANPLRSLAGVVANAAFAAMLPDTEVFRQQPGEWPLTLAGSGEGFVIQATVPATGTWTFGCAIDWDEVASTEI
jgi:hypothetical protein